MPLDSWLLIGVALGLVLFAGGALLTSRKVQNHEKRIGTIEALLAARWRQP